jgi:hypothetical protein
MASPQNGDHEEGESDAAAASQLLRNLATSRVAKTIKRHGHSIEHFLSPVIAGAAAAGLLHLLDVVGSNSSRPASRAVKFIEASVEHVHADIILLGAALLFLCLALIGSPLARWTRRLLVLPLIQLLHHVCLVGAGALFALVAAAIVGGGSLQVSATLGAGALFLLLGGAEMQLGEMISRMSDDELSKHLPVPAISAASAAATVLLSFPLWSELANAH